MQVFLVHQICYLLIFENLDIEFQKNCFEEKPLFRSLKKSRGHPAEIILYRYTIWSKLIRKGFIVKISFYLHYKFRDPNFQERVLEVHITF